MQIVFLDRETLPPEITLRPFSFAHTVSVYDRTALEEVAERIALADIVITNKVRVGRAAIAGARKLRLIAVAATGTDVIDLNACNERQIVVSNVRDYANRSVPEHVFALIFALRRSIVAYRDAVLRGRWQEARQFCFFDYPIRNLAGSRLGIVGGGRLGRATAELAAAFGIIPTFAAHEDGTTVPFAVAPFEEVLATSDVISLHVPLRPSTRHLIGAKQFTLMSRRPLLINTARGGLVDEIALGEALRGGQIAGAGFDVALREPPLSDDPLMRLLDLPNFILTPHIGWASREAIQALADQLVDNIELFCRGTPRNVVN